MSASSAISPPSSSPARISPTISSTSASTTKPKRPCASSASTSRRSSSRRRSPASATAAWAVLPPASWIRSPRSTFPPSATASATSTASSISRSATAGRWRPPTNGCGSAIPGRWSGPKTPSKSSSAATLRRYTDGNGHFRVRWIPEKLVRGIPNDTPILGYRTNTANTMRLWSAQAVESFDFESFNTGDFFGAVARQGRLGEHLQDSLPQRRRDSGQATAARAAVLLRLLLAAAHRQNSKDRSTARSPTCTATSPSR